MENINHKEISMDDYIEIESRIDSMTSEEELIETHKKLIGISCKCDYWEVKDCGVEFIKDFLSRNWKSQEAEKFIQSKYLSDYFKDSIRELLPNEINGTEKLIQSKYLSDYFKNRIRELLSDEILSNKVLNILNSDKKINDMSEEEISLIYSAINKFYTKSTRAEKVSAVNYFMSLLYELDGPGVVSFIKNNVNNRDLASHILLTSGLIDSASYYSGRGVYHGDLNENNLIAIFSKLLKLDVDYATGFVEMVRQMKTLGATEFINSFMNFADNSFKAESLNMEDSNVSLDGVYKEEKYVVMKNKKNDYYYQIRVSEQMKNSFMSRIRPILQSINTYYDGLNSQSFDSDFILEEDKQKTTKMI